MPKVLDLLHGLAVYVYYYDHGNPHCHVLKGKKGNFEAELKVELNSWKVLAVSGFSYRDCKRIIEQLQNNSDRLKEAWDEYNER
ncbi:MAG: DUF4160 domain-containing protein [Bdellovibrionales bacterium]|nr:DUF4160 domain-containing protein [Bdellovibrionales bacterium]